MLAHIYELLTAYLLFQVHTMVISVFILLFSDYLFGESKRKQTASFSFTQYIVLKCKIIAFGLFVCRICSSVIN